MKEWIDATIQVFDTFIDWLMLTIGNFVDEFMKFYFAFMIASFVLGFIIMIVIFFKT